MIQVMLEPCGLIAQVYKLHCKVYKSCYNLMDLLHNIQVILQRVQVALYEEQMRTKPKRSSGFEFEYSLTQLCGLKVQS